PPEKTSPAVPLAHDCEVSACAVLAVDSGLCVTSRHDTGSASSAGRPTMAASKRLVWFATRRAVGGEEASLMNMPSMTIKTLCDIDASTVAWWRRSCRHRATDVRCLFRSSDYPRSSGGIGAVFSVEAEPPGRRPGSRPEGPDTR